MSDAIFTICSVNYIAQARTLMQSVAAYEPEAVRYVVIVDRKTSLPDALTLEFSPLWIEDLGIDDFAFKAFIFDVLELNTNIKPSALLYLLRLHDRCVYMDPDTVLYSPLTPVWHALLSSNIALTPHVVTPVVSMARPWDQDLLRHGGFNLGFIAATSGRETDRLLRWWEGCCLSHGFNAPADGFFVDQKFIDHAAMYFDGVRVLRHLGLNVSYWNLHERDVWHDGTHWRVNTEPLVFMHYSGFIFEPTSQQDQLISKYPATVTLQRSPQLAPLYEDYRQRLVANDHGQQSRHHYGYDAFEDGTKIPQLARRLIACGALPVSDRSAPFAVGGAVHAALADMGAIPKPEGKGLPRHRDRASEQRQLRWAETLLRVIFKCLGVRRYEALMKVLAYAGSSLNQGFLVRKR